MLGALLAERQLPLPPAAAAALPPAAAPLPRASTCSDGARPSEDCRRSSCSCAEPSVAMPPPGRVSGLERASGGATAAVVAGLPQSAAALARQRSDRLEQAHTPPAPLAKAPPLQYQTQARASALREQKLEALTHAKSRGKKSAPGRSSRLTPRSAARRDCADGDTAGRGREGGAVGSVSQSC
jgi:hypothetical protein